MASFFMGKPRLIQCRIAVGRQWDKGTVETDAMTIPTPPLSFHK
jgi:hypothetical protein